MIVIAEFTLNQEPAFFTRVSSNGYWNYHRFQQIVKEQIEALKITTSYTTAKRIANKLSKELKISEIVYYNKFAQYSFDDSISENVEGTFKKRKVDPDEVPKNPIAITKNKFNIDYFEENSDETIQKECSTFPTVPTVSTVPTVPTISTVPPLILKKPIILVPNKQSSLFSTPRKPTNNTDCPDAPIKNSNFSTPRKPTNNTVCPNAPIKKSNPFSTPKKLTNNIVCPDTPIKNSRIVTENLDVIVYPDISDSISEDFDMSDFKPSTEFIQTSDIKPASDIKPSYKSLETENEKLKNQLNFWLSTSLSINKQNIKMKNDLLLIKSENDSLKQQLLIINYSMAVLN
jgi:hypothetical protein